jgi:sec-independent protein translocase protein TatB
VFGLSFGEWTVLLIVALVVFGPKELPKILRKAGQWAGKIRRFAFDVRAQSGIDEVLRNEGLDRELAEIRKLARGELDGVQAAVRSVGRVDLGADKPPPSPAASAPPASAATSGAAGPKPVVRAVDPYDSASVDREREYPREGPDAYGAMPDTSTVYGQTLPASPQANDPIYAQGEARSA